MLLVGSTYPRRVGDAQGSRGALRATSALAGDGQSLRHGLTARWLFDRLCTSKRQLVPSVLLPYNDAPRVQVVLQPSLETALLILGQYAGDTAVECFLTTIRRQHPE